MTDEGLRSLQPAQVTDDIEQVFEMNVPLDGVDSSDKPLAQIVERFHRRHEERVSAVPRRASSLDIGRAPAGL